MGGGRLSDGGGGIDKLSGGGGGKLSFGGGGNERLMLGGGGRGRDEPVVVDKSERSLILL